MSVRVYARFNIVLFEGMKGVLYIVLLVLLSWVITVPAVAQVYDAEGQYVDTLFHDHINRQADDFIKVNLVVCDPSNVLYSTLGHACLHLTCAAYDKDFYFSYESEGAQNKILTFLSGNLKMGMAAWEPEEFRAMYAADGRGVREYALNLSPQQKQALWYYLDQRVDEGLNIPYDYFRRGCAKSVVEVVNSALGQQAIQYGPWPERFRKNTQRELVADYITDSPWNEFILYFLVGTEADKRCASQQKLIIPTDLVEVWQQAAIDGHPLLSKDAQVLVEGTPKNKSVWLTPLMIAVLLLVISWFTPWPMLVVQTLLGILMCYLIGFSDLPCTTWNWLIIPFNPLSALLWHWRKQWSLPWALVLIIWTVTMVVYPHRLVDWSHIVLTLAMIVMYLKQSKYISKHI